MAKKEPKPEPTAPATPADAYATMNAENVAPAEPVTEEFGAGIELIGGTGAPEQEQMSPAVGTVSPGGHALPRPPIIRCKIDADSLLFRAFQMLDRAVCGNLFNPWSSDLMMDARKWVEDARKEIFE